MATTLAFVPRNTEPGERDAGRRWPYDRAGAPGRSEPVTVTKIHQWSVTRYLYAVLGSTVTENCPDCDVAVKFRPSLAPA
jgi:hypothetical protein